ncbi:MAG: DMT family transporter [Pyrinomonadaceae bacterium]
MSQTTRKSGAGPHLALIAVQLIFGTWGIPGKIVLQVMPVFGLSALRIAGAAAMLAVICKVRGGMGRISKKDWLLLVVCALLGVVFNQWLFATGLTLTTVVNSVLISTTIPVFTLLIGALLGTERASLRRLIGIGLAAAGVVCLISPARADLASGSRLGDLLILASALMYGAYIALSKRLVHSYGALTATTWIFIVAVLPTAPIGAAATLHTSFANVHLSFWLATIYILLIPTVLAYYLNAWALSRVAPSTVAVYIYLQPLIAFALAPIMLGESLGLRAVVASLLIFAGVLIVTWRSSNKSADQVEVLETV